MIRLINVPPPTTQTVGLVSIRANRGSGLEAIYTLHRIYLSRLPLTGQTSPAPLPLCHEPTHVIEILHNERHGHMELAPILLLVGRKLSRGQSFNHTIRNP